VTGNPLFSAAALLLQAGPIAAAEGAAGLVLHARTADQQYGPSSHWDAVAQLVAALPKSVPVIGNGDVFEAADAVQMMRQTGCQGGVELPNKMGVGGVYTS
jgi:tRNA-dihydrouridine synthase